MFDHAAEHRLDVARGDDAEWGHYTKVHSTYASEERKMNVLRGCEAAIG